MPVLIETYWNVNCVRSFSFSGRPRINRNILECKYGVKWEYRWLAAGINRNILECKCRQKRPAVVTPLQVLIETYWNVNKVSDETYYEEY